MVHDEGIGIPARRVFQVFMHSFRNHVNMIDNFYHLKNGIAM